MKTVKATALALLSVAALYVMRDSRSIIPLGLKDVPGPAAPFHWKESAALFVGIRQFTGAETPSPVPYAVDDAIDLASAFSLDARVQLVPPEKVVLALSGDPVKQESKERLQKLIAAGARVSAATPENVMQLLESQTESVGRGGILVLSFATHGFNTEGVPFVLGATSSFGQPDTALSAMNIFDIAARAPRSLVLMDACRERVPGARSPMDQLNAEPLNRRRSNVAGQAILYAAPAGKFAYDDHASRNGVFTKKVLEGLACRAGQNNKAVTVETLARYVDREVLKWVKKNRDDKADVGIQQILDGRTGLLPLSICGKQAPPPVGPMSVSVAHSTVTAFDAEGNTLWQRSLGAPVIHAEAVNLDAGGDNKMEVIAATRNRIFAIDLTGADRWSAPVSAPLRTFASGTVFHRDDRRYIIALLRAERESRLAVFRPGGSLQTELKYEGDLQQLAIDRPTARHGWKIIVTGSEKDVLHTKGSTGTAFLLTGSQLKSGKPEWRGAVVPHVPIQRLEIVDVDNDAKRDIALHTPEGRVYLSFEGKVVRPDGVQFVPIAH